MRATQGFIPALLLAAGAVASSCGGDDFCSPGSYECSGGTQPAAGKSGAGAGGSSGEGALGGSTGTGGSAAKAGTAGSMSVGGSAVGGDAGTGAGMGGQAGDAGSGATGATGGSTGSGGTSAASGNAGDSGAGGMGPTKCDPTSPSSGCVLTGTAGIFVATSASGGDDANNGTQSAPVATVAHAIELAATAQVPVYVCAGTYKEHIEITEDDLALRGGYTCADSLWTFAPSKHSRIAPTTKNEALRVKSVTGLEVMDMDLASANATDPGASSVAVFVSGSTDVVFTRVRITAGNGMVGEDGTRTDYVYGDAAALKGNDATDDSGAPANDSCTCEGTSIHSKGASGGDASQSGGTGQPSTLGGGTAGQFGAPCTTGGLGGNALIAEDGAGAQVVGTVQASGWSPAFGMVGTNGTPGQGGGGGGGGLSSGNGGGGGGACGGCGGKAGGPGTGGGASIALLSVGSKVTLHSCTLQTGSAGKGGDGIAGQTGQMGGAHGNGSNLACDGGNGGTGSSGGAGGGGAGGISVGILYDNGPSVISADSKTVITPGTAGLGGLGGGTSNKGLDGVAVKQLAI